MLGELRGSFQFLFFQGFRLSLDVVLFAGLQMNFQVGAVIVEICYLTRFVCDFIACCWVFFCHRKMAHLSIAGFPGSGAILFLSRFNADYHFWAMFLNRPTVKKAFPSFSAGHPRDASYRCRLRCTVFGNLRHGNKATHLIAAGVPCGVRSAHIHIRRRSEGE